MRRPPWVDTIVRECERGDLFPYLSRFVEQHCATKVLLVADENTVAFTQDLLIDRSCSFLLETLTLPIGEKSKGVDSLLLLWDRLLALECTCSDLVLCVGGGALSDVAALASSTYKRGLHLVLIPTTILSACDASYGGKCAIDCAGVKNTIGTYYPADEVWLCADLWNSLSPQEIFSGYGELLKYSLLQGADATSRMIAQPLTGKITPELRACVTQSLLYKKKVVDSDPYDSLGIRACLNLGHTYGHAFEALSSSKGLTLPHGIAVAAGLFCELYLSYDLGSFARHMFGQVAAFIRQEFPPLHFDCDDYADLYRYARQDKKNTNAAIHCVSLDQDFRPFPFSITDADTWEKPLDFYREYMSV